MPEHLMTFLKKRTACFACFFVFFIMTSVPAFGTEPVVTITSPDDGSDAFYGNRVDFVGSAVDDTDGDSIASYSWTSDLDGALSTDPTFHSNNLSVGEHSIKLFATDSGSETGFAQISLIIKNNNPTARIISPYGGRIFDYGQNIPFTGKGTDIKDGILFGNSMSWSSDIDGVIGTGQNFGTTNLSSGSHTITLTVTDSNGGTGTATVVIQVRNTVPETEISAPADGSNFAFGELITFQGKAVDPEQGNLIGDALVWTSSQGDPMGTGENPGIDTLSSGSHVITLTATDSGGNSSSDDITISIGNAPPHAEITAPEDGSSFGYKEFITFKGIGSDTEDGDLAGSALVWTRSAAAGEDVEIGTGKTLSVNNFPSGTHTIVLTVTDTEGLYAEDSIALIVGNALPSAEIIAPLNDSAHVFGTAIQFEGSAVDPEDGSLTDSSLSWSSSKDGVIGSGASVSRSDLSVGSHVITLAAKDSEGKAAEASINITVGDQAPDSISIDTPMDGASFYLGEFIEFKGIASDKEDGSLKGASLVWTSDFEKTSLNPAGTIGEGNSFSVSNLKKGEHLITLTATDSSGASVSTFIVIEVLNQLPVPRITAPLNNASFVQGEEVKFSASVTDAEDVQLTGSALVWKSDIDDVIGTGVTPSAVLSSGKHTITLMAIDAQGDSAEDSISLTVEAGQENDPLALEKDNVSVNFMSLCLDATETISITGGFLPLRANIKQYSPKIVESEITHRILKIKPLETGTTTLEVRDHNEHVISLTVEVLPESGEFSTASAGPDQNVMEFETVTLDGSFSVPGNSGITSWNWQQISGSVNVVLSDPSAEITTFVAPCADFVSSLTFQLTITDNKGNKSTDEITVSVGDNGIEQFPDLAATFKSADGSHNLGMNIVGQGDLVLLKGRYSEFISEQYNRPGNMIYGLIQCRIKVPSPGDRADFIIYLPQGLAQDYSCYKYNDAKGWYGVTENIMFDAARQKAYISIVDGGPCDDDGAADGIITDPLTFGTPPMENTDPPAAEEDSGGGGGGGGGGCFLSTLF
ncbi:MAG: choice-of-anchor U domain-containing protein [Thermodesulfobacteriota bacterium]|nr:choice-of-anchor U domain-containing protein [Thermodesulfobacteriota bacterium]